MESIKVCAFAVLFFGGLLWTSPATSRSAAVPPAKAEGHQDRLWKESGNPARFSAIPRLTWVSCESSIPPEPLTTPGPVIDSVAAQNQLSVSFIIGTDGLVHSALLLNSVSGGEDRVILTAVRSWRYRPAMCNGVPTEVEATVDFSSHRRRFGLK